MKMSDSGSAFGHLSCQWVMVKRTAATTLDANQGKSGGLMTSKRGTEEVVKLNSKGIRVVVTRRLHERCCDWVYGGWSVLDP